MKKAPFVFGKIATSPEFTDRENEVELLKSNFQNSVNTIIISPRRWGKSSLVSKVTDIINNENNDTTVVSLDLFNIKNEEEFYIQYAKEVLTATATKWEEFASNAKKFLSHLLPQITFSPDNISDISFGVEWEILKKQPDEILNLAEKIAVEKNIRIIVSIDEFQNIAYFDDPLAFQKKLRSQWQKHQNSAYCLYGSKRHMLMDVFSNPSMPFYKFGEILFLEKITEEKWIPFITDRFSETGKQISNKQAKEIARLVNNHPYYVQQLAQQVWFRTARKCQDEHIPDAYNNIVNQLSLLFINITDTLSKTELSLLKAILKKEKQLTAQKTLKKYHLGTSANVIRLRRILIDREIIGFNQDTLFFQDPFFASWLETEYF